MRLLACCSLRMMKGRPYSSKTMDMVAEGARCGRLVYWMSILLRRRPLMQRTLGARLVALKIRRRQSALQATVRAWSYAARTKLAHKIEDGREPEPFLPAREARRRQPQVSGSKIDASQYASCKTPRSRANKTSSSCLCPACGRGARRIGFEHFAVACTPSARSLDDGLHPCVRLAPYCQLCHSLCAEWLRRCAH